MAARASESRDVARASATRRSARRIARRPRHTACRRAPASWFYVFGSGTLVVLRHPGAHRHLPGAGLRAVGERGVDEPRSYLNYEQSLGWFLRALHNWGSNFMVADHDAAHDPGLPVRRLQVSRASSPGSPAACCCSARSAWRSPARCCASIRTPTGGSASASSILARTPVLGAPLVHAAARRADHRRRDAVALLHAARLRHSRADHRAGQPAPAAGADGSASTSGRCPGGASSRATYRDEYEALCDARRRAVRARRDRQGPGLRRRRASSRIVALRGGLRSRRPERPARPDADRDQPAARLLLPARCSRSSRCCRPTPRRS